MMMMIERRKVLSQQSTDILGPFTLVGQCQRLPMELVARKAIFNRNFLRKVVGGIDEYLAERLTWNRGEGERVFFHNMSKGGERLDDLVTQTVQKWNVGVDFVVREGVGIVEPAPSK